MNLEIGYAYSHGGLMLKASCLVFTEEDRNVINIERKVSLLLVHLCCLFTIYDSEYI